MGLFVAGNTVGGLSGRLLSSAVATSPGGALGSPPSASWRWPASWRSACCCRHRRRRRSDAPARLGSHLALHLRDRGVRRLCLSSFVLMAGFVTVYNFLGYRLLEPPFGLSQLLVGLVFVSTSPGR
jgi:YNFM family putative membrane transporter